MYSFIYIPHYGNSRLPKKLRNEENNDTFIDNEISLIKKPSMLAAGLHPFIFRSFPY